MSYESTKELFVSLDNNIEEHNKNMALRIWAGHLLKFNNIQGAKEGLVLLKT